MHPRNPVHRLRAGAIASLLGVGLLTGGCSSSPEPSAAFCDRLATATSSTGAETLYTEYDPARVSATTEELRELRDLAPDEVAATMEGLVALFDEVGDSSDDEASAILIANELEMTDLSTRLTDYALEECGLFLQRAPQPTPTSAPLISNE